MTEHAVVIAGGDRFLSQGQVAQVAGFAGIPLDISDFPTRHNHREGRGKRR